MKDILKLLIKSVLKGLTASASTTDASTHKKMFGSGRPNKFE